MVMRRYTSFENIETKIEISIGQDIYLWTYTSLFFYFFIFSHVKYSGKMYMVCIRQGNIECI